jgi:formylglycine-generating enzyme required for sulfatase activity
MSTRPASLASFSNRELDPQEVCAYLDAPVTDAERAEVLALVAWFRRRYPTPAERLAYVRRAYVRWQRTLGIAAED